MDDGNTSTDGDVKLNDGTYSALFADTSKPGLYKFHVTMDWDNPTTGRIHREETLQTQVGVTPDPTASVVTVAQGTTAGNWSMVVTPIDKFGNYLGPGYAPTIQVGVAGGGSVSGPLADPLQTGSYGINLAGVLANTDPTITIVAGGVTIRDCKLSTCAGGGSGTTGTSSKWWWWWIILLLILLLLAVLLLRRFKII